MSKLCLTYRKVFSDYLRIDVDDLPINVPNLLRIVSFSSGLIKLMAVLTFSNTKYIFIIKIKYLITGYYLCYISIG